LSDTQEYWAIIELMGHVRMAGKVSEVERYGAKVGRIDVPDGDGFRTLFFGGPSIYRETPVTEDVARLVAKQCDPAPVHSWEMPRALPEHVEDAETESDYEDDHPEDDLARPDKDGAL